MTSILITGGAGFIGSHTALVLLEAGHSLVVLDNFANSSPESLRRVLELAGPDAEARLTVVEATFASPTIWIGLLLPLRPASPSRP